MKTLPCLLLLLLGATLASAAPRRLTIGLVAKSQSNPVFQAARVGAEDAARELGARHNLDIRIDWRTPNEEDAQKQAEAVEQLVLAGAEGLAISCSDANKLTDAINRAVDQGVPVVTFDSDAPASKRFVTYGVDDFQCGRQTMAELARVMHGQGVVAVLAGNPNAPNLQRRVQGVRAEAARHPGITIRDVYYHKETPQDAAAKVEQVMQANPEITGWAMIGGWALFTDNALKWPPGTVQCVSVDALPAQLAYIRSGHVPVLLAQQCYQWGHRSVELLVEKLVEHRDPPAAKEISALIPVTRENVDEFAKNWTKWLRN
ncbi:MAG: substrate-binding domain-containing protein [Opitutaceae bacterium]|nr:substrate-binding domain-containing protein [Opitutaceae bacterium]